MKKIEIGNRKIYKLNTGATILDIKGKIYILDDSKWIDDDGKIYRKLSSIDLAMLQELGD